jgi:hypothetical protein
MGLVFYWGTAEIKRFDGNLYSSTDKQSPLDQKMAVSSALACGKPTTNLQPEPDAEPKKGDSAISAGSRSSRADFPSSSNLKIKSAHNHFN